MKFADRFPHPAYLAALLRFASPLGLPRVFGWCSETAACPDCVKYTKAVLAEYGSYSESHREASETRTLGNKPPWPCWPTILQPGCQENGTKSLRRPGRKWQQDLSHLSTNSSLAVAEGSGHEIQTEQPQLVIGEMLKVVAEVHSHLGS